MNPDERLLTQRILLERAREGLSLTVCAWPRQSSEPTVAPLAEGCTAACTHADPGGKWHHDVKVLEDSGGVHTDDCGFFACIRNGEPEHDHDPGDCCTSGQPGAKCRARTAVRK